MAQVKSPCDVKIVDFRDVLAILRPSFALVEVKITLNVKIFTLRVIFLDFHYP